MSDKVKYPIGEQDFKSLRETGSIYVDKTGYIGRLLSSGSKYYFLARPRRFGKSLFLSTLRYFFEGYRELFHGLAVERLEWDWECHPVLRLDLNTSRYDEPGLLDVQFDNIFRMWEKKYDVSFIAGDLSTRMHNIIERAHEVTGRKVVVLVDEYDKPLVGNLNEDERFEHYRAKLASVYSNFKSSAEHIRLIFMTGVSRFGKLSVFSDLNNLRDITFTDGFSDICGITEKELLDNFETGIGDIARAYGITYAEACAKLKRNYDGYRFTGSGSDIYNPWSVLNALENGKISNYWSQTGSPTVIAEVLKKADVDLKSILNTRCPLRQLVGQDLRSADPVALMYQTGYLTIKSYDGMKDTVTLGVPNSEVKESLLEDLLPYYVKIRRGTPEGVVFAIIGDLEEGRPDKFVKDLDIFLAGIPYEMKMEDENNFHNALYILLTLIGVNAETEMHTSDGRIDLVIKTREYVYVMELKFDGSAHDAMEQIEAKQYDLSFGRDPRHLFRIGLNFSKETRHLDQPVIR